MRLELLEAGIKNVSGTVKYPKEFETVWEARKNNELLTGSLAKVAVQCSADTLVVNQGLVLRINISGKNRHIAKPLTVRCRHHRKHTDH